MQIIFELNSIRELASLKKYHSIIHYIEIGVENYSFCSPLCFKIDELNQVIDQIINCNLEVVLNFERVYTDIELNKIKNLLPKINLDKIAYFTYSDLGFNNLMLSLNLKDKLIYRSPTYLTNYSDVNIYQRFNQYVTLSSEVSSDELMEMLNKVNNKVIVDLFGQNAVFHSRRMLIKNFFTYKKMDLDSKKEHYQLIEELRDEPYPIREYEDYTVVFEPKHYFLSDKFRDLLHSNKVDLAFVHTNNLKYRETLLLASLLVNYITSEDIQYINTIKEKFNTYSGAYGNNSYLLKSEVKDHE